MEYIHFVNYLLFSALALIAEILGLLNFVAFFFNKKESNLYNAIYLSAVYFIYLWLT